MATHLANKMATYAPSVRDNEIDLQLVNNGSTTNDCNCRIRVCI